MSIQIKAKKNINVEYIKCCDQKLENDFEIKLNCNVCFFKSKELLEKQIGEDLPDWVIGTFKGNNIFLLDKACWKYPNITSYEKLIIHELTHIYTNHITQECPIWIMEGLAMFYASQIEELLIDNQKQVLNPYYLSYEDDIYFHAASIIKELIKWYDVKILVKRLYHNMEKYYQDPIVGVDVIEALVNGLNKAQ